MRSEHVDRFNHDEDAAEYDVDVQNETDPIRGGYAELLAWVAERACIERGSRVLELGSGTGNLTALLPPAKEILCVDVSHAMAAIAREKLATRGDVTWIRADLLECLDAPHASARGHLDRVVSTYALHHLTSAERGALFVGLGDRMASGGRVAIGDLMFADPDARRSYLEDARARGEEELAEAIEHEFFWDLSEDVPRIEALGWKVEVRSFSALSWGLVASMP